MKRILVTGSRNWTNEKVIELALWEQWVEFGRPKDCVLIEGEAKGADTIARDIWESKGLPVEKYPADWSLGKAAGHIRNKQMVDSGADVCLAFPLGESRGTHNCMEQARKAGIPVKVFF